MKTPDVNQDIQKSIKDKIKSKSFAVTSQIGKAQLFDIRNLDGIDYTAGGALKGFWFKNEDARIRDARAKGYAFPEDFDQRLKNQTLGDMVLMLQTDEARVDYRQQVRKRIHQLEGSTMENHPKAKAHATNLKLETIRPE